MLNKLLTSVLTLFLSFQLYGQDLADISFGTDSTFEVVTWNIETFPKNGSITIDSVSKIIESLDVDLIGLQEVDDSTLCRQMIDNLPGYEIFMDDVWFGGLAYIYKTSSVSIQSIYKIYDTSPFWNAFPRSPLVIELIFNGEPFTIINNHFKCCGDGILDAGNPNDEETRRHEASTLLKQYIDENFNSSRVIVIGDLNDIITDLPINNVYQMFIDDSTNYAFADMSITSGASSEWSFPSWPSHLDHILITNELFTEFTNPNSEIKTIKIDDFLAGGLAEYDLNISDHRPVGLKIQTIPTALSLVENSNSNIKIFPNPTHGYCTIDLGETYNTVTIIITDLNGKVIQSNTYNESQIFNLNLNEPAGVYLLMIETENEETLIRLIKE
jgi:endonuclease/exonuclease/phosphatase family metal-dependent hydrolase